MNVGSAMARDIMSCTPDHPLSCAARIMWERDCGAVPVVDAEGKAIGMITDRDICMATYTRNLPPSQMTVESACSGALVAVSEGASIESAEALMQKHKIRRLPVIDAGGFLVGVLSLADLARTLVGGRRRADGEIAATDVAMTLAAISMPSAAAVAE